MKRLFLIVLFASFVGATFGQSLKKIPNMSGSRAKFRINAAIQDVNDNYDSTAVLRVDIDENRDTAVVHRVDIDENRDTAVVHRVDIDENRDTAVVLRVDIDENRDTAVVLRVDIDENRDTAVVHRTDIDENRDTADVHRVDLTDNNDSTVVLRTDAEAIKTVLRTSSGLAGSLSDETGTGGAVFASDPTFAGEVTFANRLGSAYFQNLTDVSALTRKHIISGTAKLTDTDPFQGEGQVQAGFFAMQIGTGTTITEARTLYGSESKATVDRTMSSASSSVVGALNKISMRESGVFAGTAYANKTLLERSGTASIAVGYNYHASKTDAGYTASTVLGVAANTWNYGIDFNAGTMSTGDIRFQNGAIMHNIDADTVEINETVIKAAGKFYVRGSEEHAADYAIFDFQVPLLEYWAKTQEIGKLPAMEGRNRDEILSYISGVEETAERLLRYIVELEERITELEK